MVLVGYWPLNESSGSTAYDHSGNENQGTIKDGGDSTVPGANGILGQNAYSFDGNNDYVDSGDVNKVESITQLSISAWMKVNKDGNQDNVIANKSKVFEFVQGDGYGSNNWGLFAYTGDGSSWGDSINDGTVRLDGNWHHAVFILDSSRNYATIHVDGIQTAEKTSFSTGIGSNGESLEIGARTGNGWYMKGNLAEIRFYNHALTPAEVQYLYSVSKRGRQTTFSKQS